MTKAKSVNLLGEREHYSEALALLKKPGDYALVRRGIPRSVVMACPDACGDILALNLDRRAGKAWRIYGYPIRLSVYPSVWRESGCRAHFIVWQGRILWCLAETHETPRIEQSLVNDVLGRLPSNQFVHYEELANSADLNPWEVLWACDVLVQNRKAIKGPKGTFKARITGKSGKE